MYANKAIKILSVEGSSASTASIADGSYPLYSILYLAARDDGKNREAAEKFIKYASSDAGKAIIRKHQLLPYDDAPDLVAKEDQRVAFVDAHISGTPVETPTRVSAPNATADYLVRTQPNSLEAQAAKQHAAEVTAEKKAAKAAQAADKSN